MNERLEVHADESGTDGLAPCVCGCIASSDYWAKFCDEWTAVLKAYSAPYFHFRELNPSERAKPKNPYHGWDDERADDFIHDLAIVAGREAVPFGGGVRLIEPKERKLISRLYEEAFEHFFNDFANAMDEHWPKFKEAVTFFIEENTNKHWIAALNNVITASPVRVSGQPQSGLLNQMEPDGGKLNQPEAQNPESGQEKIEPN